MYHGSECGCGHHGQRAESGRDWGHGEWRGHHSQPGVCRMHHAGGHYCNCGCHQSVGMHPRHHLWQRRFLNKEEVIARLEEYLKQLQAEAKAVAERIAELKKEAEPKKEG